MTELKLRYNPYEQKTEYEIYSEEKKSWVTPVSESPLAQPKHTNGTLKSHIEDSIKVLDEKIGVNGLKITFEGTDSDFEEVRDYINYYNEIKAKSIELKKSDNHFRKASDVLPLLEQSFLEVKNSLGKYRTGETSKEIENCLDVFKTTIPICVMGLYSVGKSAFINAIIGREILPSASDPTTAKVYKISNKEKCEIRYMIGVNPKSKLFENADGKKIYDFLKEINTDEQVGDLIEIDVPFVRSVLSKDYDFVIYDTPGSDSKTNEEHLQVLERCLEKQTNGLPVFVTEPNSMDKKSLGEIKDKFEGLKLDIPNILIVVNRADGTGNEDLKNKKKNKGELEITTEKSGGVFFVSSIIGIGAKKENFNKNNESEWIDPSYYEGYRKNFDDFSTTEGKYAKSLYKYNFMIESEQKAYCEEAEKVDSSDTREILYYNSGIHCVEKSISEYAEKYASYNKCKNSIEFFENASNFVTKRINELSVKLNADKKEVRSKLLKDLGKKYVELKTAYSTESIKENDNHLNKFYNKKDNDSKILSEWDNCKKDNNYEKRITEYIKNDIVDAFLKKWHEEIVTFSRDFWFNKTEDYKKECVKVITGSEITDEQKKSLSEIVFSADSPDFTDEPFTFESDFKVVKKLFGFIPFIKWLNNELFSKIHSFLTTKSGEQNTAIQKLHSKEFNEWTVRLETELDKKMDEFNDQLRKWTEEIKDLENNRNVIEDHLKESKGLLELVVDKESQNG